MQSLLPMMQFSAAPWRHLSPEGVRLCRAFADLHIAFGPYIMETARHAAKTGEPIVRAMEYEFPHQGFNHPMQQFMLGDRWLVAPVITPDDAKVVELPAGKVRQALNLVDHPELIGKRVKVKGDLVDKYFGTVGLKSTTDYEMP